MEFLWTDKCFLLVLFLFGSLTLGLNARTIAGTAKSAYNMAALLRREGVKARFIDLTGWRTAGLLPLDQRLRQAFDELDVDQELPIVTGYCQCAEGMVRSGNIDFDIVIATPE